MLERHEFKYIAVDNDAAAVPDKAKQAVTVFYGDATNPEFLKHAASWTPPPSSSR